LRGGSIFYNIQKPLVCMRVSKDFYARRGGLPYLKALLRFNLQQYRSGWFSLFALVRRSCANIGVCLMPNHIRKITYAKLLRK
jgi:hypothetical protein